MPELIAGLIDVFADAPPTGNPLAVVQDADGLSDEQMRRIAGELNQAETTFILQSVRADGRLRSFTASGAEVFGAGHNALGAWLWLGEHGDLGPLEPVYDLLSSNLRKARWIICRLVFSLRSQFFQSRRHFSSHAKDRSTIHRLGSTANVCSWLRLTI